MTFEEATLCFHWTVRTMAVYLDLHYYVLAGSGCILILESIVVASYVN